MSDEQPRCLVEVHLCEFRRWEVLSLPAALPVARNLDRQPQLRREADDVSSGERTEAQERLDRAGVDVSQLQTDFVSYQAVRTYLTSVREASYEPDADRAERVTETTRKLQARTAAVTERNLEQLRKTERITLGSIRLFVDVTVLCEDCGAQYQADELLERGGCDCDA